MLEHQKSLLLVDDDEVYCRVLKKALEKRNFDVTATRTADQANTIISETPFHYSVLDLCIENISGLTLIQPILENNPDAKIVMLTGYASIATAVESIKLGAIHYLNKPATADEIVSSLDRVEGNAETEIDQRPVSPKRMEWEHLQKVMTEFDGNISAAARAMGMHRRTLQRKLQKKPVQR